MNLLDIINIIANVFTCIGIIIAILEFYLMKKSTLADSERSQKQATLDFYMTVKDDLYMYNHSIYIKFKRNEFKYTEIEKDDEFILILKNYLNIMEIMATGINTGIYNIDVFDRLYGDVCMRVADQLKDYIEKRRNMIGEEEIYRDYDLLISKLEKIHSNNELLNSRAIIKNTFDI